MALKTKDIEKFARFVANDPKNAAWKRGYMGFWSVYGQIVKDIRAHGWLVTNRVSQVVVDYLEANGGNNDPIIDLQTAASIPAEAQPEHGCCL